MHFWTEKNAPARQCRTPINRAWKSQPQGGPKVHFGEEKTPLRGNVALQSTGLGNSSPKGAPRTGLGWPGLACTVLDWPGLAKNAAKMPKNIKNCSKQVQVAPFGLILGENVATGSGKPLGCLPGPKTPPGGPRGPRGAQGGPAPPPPISPIVGRCG